MPPYRILLAEDHVLFREVIKKAINGSFGLQVAGEVSDGLELLSFLKELVPDLIILDISMPKMSGLEAAQKIKANYPQVKILILTMHKSMVHIRGAMEAQVDGYLLKENAYADLLTAIEVIKHGGVYISPLIHGQIKDSFRQGKQSDQSQALSPREKEILSLLATGMSYKDIARRLSISFGTVETYARNIKYKLHIETKAQLIDYARSSKEE